jgi:hypothetical protein
MFFQTLIHRCAISLCLFCGLATGTPIAHAFDLLAGKDIKSALACNMLSTFRAVMKNLVEDADSMVKQGRLQKYPFTKLRDDNKPVMDYRFTKPIAVFGFSAVGFNNHFGMLPAYTVFFNAQHENLINALRKSHASLSCELGGNANLRSCGARSPVPTEESPPGQTLDMVLITSEGYEIMEKENLVMVSCIVLPREGNPFR